MLLKLVKGSLKVYQQVFANMGKKVKAFVRLTENGLTQNNSFAIVKLYLYKLFKVVRETFAVFVKQQLRYQLRTNIKIWDLAFIQLQLRL